MKRILHTFFPFFFLGYLFLSSYPQPAFSGPEPVIAVIRSRVIKPYQDALSGFEEELNKSGYKITPRRFDLENAKGKETQLMQEIKDLKPVLVFVIGTEASLFAKENFKELPVIFSMVLSPVKSGIVESLTNPGNNLTGISLDILPEVQFRKLKEMLPKVSRVGVIYNAKEKDWIKEIEEAAKKTGLAIVAKPINSESDVPAKLAEISKEADCIWAQAEPSIYNAQSSQYILLQLLRNKIPFMAFSSQYVKAGALLSLECDYNDIGRESAQIAIKVLNGANLGSTPVAFPEKINLAVNQKIA
ncbi:MAG: ABC transporter substrate-binding protein [Candidatus Omnitrophota bacterium]